MPPDGPGLATVQAFVAVFAVPLPYIIAVTASFDRHACEAAGMNAFLDKPIHLHDLAVMLTRAGRQPDSGAG